MCVLRRGTFTAHLLAYLIEYNGTPAGSHQFPSICCSKMCSAVATGCSSCNAPTGTATIIPVMDNCAHTAFSTHEQSTLCEFAQSHLQTWLQVLLNRTHPTKCRLTYWHRYWHTYPSICRHTSWHFLAGNMQSAQNPDIYQHIQSAACTRYVSSADSPFCL